MHIFVAFSEKLNFYSLVYKNFVGHKLEVRTLESGIDVGQLINVGPGKFGKKNKHRAYSMYSRLRNKHRAMLISFWNFFQGLHPY